MFKQEIKQGVACDSVGKPHSVLGRTVCLSVHPGKMVLLPFIQWFDKRYKGRFKFATLLFGFDLLLIGTLIGLCVSAFVLWMVQPSSFEDGILFEATVAPREIQTGSPSTLIIRYTNETDEALRDTTLHLTYPDQFLLQELTSDAIELENNAISLGTIPVGGTGTVHIRGVMFGDVGGEQSFTSILTFLHGTQRDTAGRKTSVHTFSPTSSALKLALTLPPRLIAFQEVEGVITYHNTSPVPFPAIRIEPVWPEGFSLVSSSVPVVQNGFEVPAISAGESGEILFTGSLGDVGETLTFTFNPSFVFDTSRYQQDQLVHTADVIPLPVTTELLVDKSTVRPGVEAVFTVIYENTGDDTITNLVLGVEANTPFLSQTTYTSTPIPELLPGASGEVTIRAPLRSTIYPSETSDYDGLDLVGRATATYTLGDGTGQQVLSKSPTVSTPITTPVTLESFGRYATASGDQLGRGPLPPRVGSETKYWVFWHVGGTINELQHVRIEGTLGDGVVFTGRQSSYQNSGVTYDADTRTIRWTTDSMAPNLSPASKIVGVAFELGLTPTAEKVGETPILLYDVRLTGTDARTGAFVSRSGTTVTTNLPGDLMADGKAVVED